MPARAASPPTVPEPADTCCVASPASPAIAGTLLQQFWAIFSDPFDTSSFPPRWFCGQWSAALGWLHVLSDTTIFLSYMLIPISIAIIVSKRRDIPFSWLFVLFAMFILACGTTHLLEAVIFWAPVYRFAGIVKLITALVSMATFVAIIPIVPRIIAFRSPEALEREVAQRTAELQDRSLELEHANADLAEAKRRADEATQAKTAFLANMSHEIRTPMTAILGYTELLLSESRYGPAGAAEQRQYCEVIRQNGEHLLELINELLDVAKVEAGKLTVEQVQFNLPEWLSGIESTMRVRALDKQIGFSIETLNALPSRAIGDPTRLRQIVLNLLGNAIKFTERGSVRMIVRTRQDADQPTPRLQFDVIDTGVGLTEAQAAHLFEPFAQGDTSITRRFGGTGLGLALSRKIAGMLGGQIELVSSKPNVGSQFRLIVPIAVLDSAVSSAPAASTKPTPKGTPRLRGLRIVLAEDGDDNRRLFTRVLQAEGARVEAVEHGGAAVAAVSSALAREAPPDVVVLDLQMPLMDGFSALLELRARDYAGPVLALTAHAHESDIARCRAAGFDGFVAKPVDFDLLVNAIRDALAGRSPSS